MVGMFALSGVLVWLSVDQEEDYSSKESHLQTETEQRNLYLIYTGAAVMCILTSLLFCILVAMRKRIRASIQLLEFSAKALTSMPSTFSIPIVVMILTVVCVITSLS